MDGFVELTFLALVQGLTEFLPISSSGHLVLSTVALSALGGSEEDLGLAVDVALHVGTLLAVLVVYRRDVAGLLVDVVRGRWREPGLIVLGTVPVVIVGFTLLDRIEALFHSTTAAGFGLLGTATVLTIGEWSRRTRAGVPVPEEARALPVRAVLVVGLAQAMAILPGVSRSGSTIAAGLFMGLAPQRAARLSFLLSIPAITGAAVLMLPDLGGGEDGGPGGGLLAWAVLFSGLVGWGALRLLLAFLDRGAFLWFAGYCAVVGTGVLLFA